LGYALLICPFSPTDLEAELARGGSGTVATDVSPALGPFVVTPEELAEYGVSGEPTAFQSTYEIKVNEEVVGKGNWQSHCSFVELLQLSSISSPVTSGEIIAFPPLAQSPLIETSFGRELLPGDKVSATVEGFGTLVVRIG
jgi:2-keto-4-pentenoate hydratase/2-oxohepta-3-ene-1,7-dioic acid hydratase in catechol pathway